MVGLWIVFDWEFCDVAGFDSNDVIDKCCSLASASWMEGKECPCADCGSLSSSMLGRGSTGDVSPPKPMTELAVEDGYEYGGGGPEYICGLTKGGAGIFRVAEIESRWL